MSIRRWDVAIHEASHAVVAHEFHKPVNRVSVVAQGDSLGHTNISNLNDWDAIHLGDGMNQKATRKLNHRQRRTVAILVAGDVGNNIDSGRALVSQQLPAQVLHDLANRQHAASAALHQLGDMTRAFTLAIQLPGQADQELCRGEEWARRILLRRLRKLQRLAKAVFGSGMIHGSDLQSILSRNAR